MKITIVQGAFLPVPPLMGGAVEKVWFRLGQEFVKHGHQVIHISKKHPQLSTEESIEGVNHQRIRGFDIPASLFKLKLLDLFYSARVLSALPDADILVTNTFWLPIIARCTKKGKVYVHIARYPKGQMRFYKHAARLQTVSRPIQRAIVTECPAVVNITHTIPYPIPFAPFESTEQKKQILYVGRVHPEKGVHLLIQAFCALPTSIQKEWKLRIVGPWQVEFGGGGQNYFEKLKKLAISAISQIEWMGAVFKEADLCTIYRQASLFVYPSLAEKGETFGLAPLEAMSQTCPSLVSDLECFKDFIVDGENGYVFDHRKTEGNHTLEHRLRVLLETPETLKHTGTHAFASSQKFTLDRIAKRYLDDFASLLNR